MEDFEIRITQKNIYDVTVRAKDIDEAKVKAFDKYTKACEQGKQGEYFSDSDVEID